MSNRRTQLAKDDRLADFTDRLLAGKIEQDVTHRESDPELVQMQETLQQLRKAFPPAQDDAEMRNRIRARLTAEWRNNIPVQTAKKSMWFSNRTLSLSFAVAAVAIVVLIVSFLPQGQAGISGTAGTGATWIPLAIFLIIIAGLIFWQLRKK
jgi:hypothetical protein